MMLIYVDDILCISHDPHATMKGIQATFKLKDDKFEKPEIYLGAMLTQKIINGMECWTISSEQYVKASVANVEAALTSSGQRLPSRCTTPNSSQLSTGAGHNSGAKIRRHPLLSRDDWSLAVGDRTR